MLLSHLLFCDKSLGLNEVGYKLEKGETLINLDPLPSNSKFRKNENLLQVRQMIKNSINSEIELISIKGSCSCFLEARFSGRLEAQKQGSIDLLFDISNFKNLERFDTTIVLEYRNAKSSNTLHQAIAINVALNSNKVHFLPPSQEVSIAQFRSNPIKVRKRILVPPSMQISDLKVESDSGLSKVFVKSITVYKLQNIIYYGDWKEIARVHITIDENQCHLVKNRVCLDFKCSLKLTDDNIIFSRSSIIIY